MSDRVGRLSWTVAAHESLGVGVLNYNDKQGARGSHRGRGRGGGGRGGGGAGGRGGYHGAQQQEKPKKESILDLSKYMEKKVRVRFNGGREGLWRKNESRVNGFCWSAMMVQLLARSWVTIRC